MRYITKEIPDFMKEAREYTKRSIHQSQLNLPTLNHTSLKIIAYLNEHEDKDVNQKELENALHLKRSTISSVLDTMENNDCIKRIPSRLDARKKIIKINEQKIPKKEDVIQYFLRVEELLKKDIPQEKLDIFFEVLDSMKENLKKGDFNDTTL